MVNYGTRLSDDEYVDAISALWRDLPVLNTCKSNSLLRCRELDCLIDWKFGKDFPSDRRVQIYKASEKLETRRLLTGFKVLFYSFFKLSTFKIEKDLFEYTKAVYKKVLSDEELAIFFDDEASPNDVKE